MVSFASTRPDTDDDRRLYTEARLVEVSCLDCTARVLVKKNSEHHTAVQWTSDAVHRCPEFARMNAEPGGRRVYAGCDRLRASIDRAVREGRIHVGAIDGY